MVQKKKPKTKGLQSATQVLLLCCVHREGSELLRAGRARTSRSIPGKGMKFSSFPKRLYRLWLPSQAPIRRVRHVISPAIRQSECAADHSHFESILRMIEATLLHSHVSPCRVRPERGSAEHYLRYIRCC
jgi:hypothetical protein